MMQVSLIASLFTNNRISLSKLLFDFCVKYGKEKIIVKLNLIRCLTLFVLLATILFAACTAKPPEPEKPSTPATPATPAKTSRKGATTIGVYRPEIMTFLLRNSNNSGEADVNLLYGAKGDIPIV